MANNEKYNKTQLHPERALSRHVFHRDQFAHYLRWSHCLKIAKQKMKILDFGCGNGNIYEVFYRNRKSPEKYIGLDVRKQIIKIAQEKFPKATFMQADVVKMTTDFGTDWDLITCFELVEHIGKENVHKLMENMKRHMNEDTILLISTPCYDEKVGAADNHIIDGQIGEFTFEEFKKILKQHFEIKEVFGTFASIKDYKPHLNNWQKKMYEKMHEYFDVNVLSVIMAPLFPEHSRNCLWKCTKKTSQKTLKGVQ
jgi:2-polyprenyl-3-methyl-5-hydroxy-6-metoxy-1,4-benzoquinol methylase